jgi:hypothetical protein
LEDEYNEIIITIPIEEKIKEKAKEEFLQKAKLPTKVNCEKLISYMMIHK